MRYLRLSLLFLSVARPTLETMQLWQYMVGVLTLCITWLLWLRERRARRKYAGLPTLPLLPFIGNLHQAFGDGKVLFRLLQRITAICEKTGGGRLVIWLGPSPIFTTYDPEDVKTITNAFIEKPHFYSFGKSYLGNGLITAPGSIWKQNIKKLAGTFSSSVVDGYIEVFNAQAEKLVQSLRREGKEPFDIMEKYLTYSLLEAICQTALGVSKISENKNIVTSEYYEAFNRIFELFITRGTNPLLHPEFIYKMTPAYKEMKKCIAILHNVSETILKRRIHEREMLKKLGNTKKVDINGKESKFKSYLDILLDLRDIDPSFTEQQIKSEVDTIIIAGQETVATTLFYILLMIGSKSRVQNKLYTEMRTIFGDSTRPVTKKDLSEMKYLEAVINETLRMFPPAPAVMRQADRDLELKSFTVPKGTICFINIWGAGRLTRAWGEDATLFRPERWLEGQLPSNHAAFLAFSYSRRSCIGKKYAMSILKTILAHCIRQLEFVSQTDHLQFKMDILLRVTSGHLIQVRRRNEK